jgi:hypothetical protein
MLTYDHMFVYGREPPVNPIVSTASFRHFDRREKSFTVMMENAGFLVASLLEMAEYKRWRFRRRAGALFTSSSGGLRGCFFK